MNMVFEFDWSILVNLKFGFLSTKIIYLGDKQKFYFIDKKDKEKDILFQFHDLCTVDPDLLVSNRNHTTVKYR